jgi:hypothetical protein
MKTPIGLFLFGFILTMISMTHPDSIISLVPVLVSIAFYGMSICVVIHKIQKGEL